ncbi:hypothetical protein Tco_0446453 [Tanacetum coccineum]
MTKTEVIKIVQEEAEKIGIDPKKVISTKAEIPEELRIQSALPALVPEQAPSQSLRRKRKHMELEPEIKVPGLECNRSLPKGVPFVNNMVIEELEYMIFFTDVFVMDSMIKTLENARFSLKLKKLIAEHPD